MRDQALEKERDQVRRRTAASETRPRPNNSAVLGSGTGVPEALYSSEIAPS
jgi:hypothetical protein